MGFTLLGSVDGSATEHQAITVMPSENNGIQGGMELSLAVVHAGMTAHLSTRKSSVDLFKTDWKLPN